MNRSLLLIGVLAIVATAKAHAACEGLKGSDFTRCKNAAGQREIGEWRNPSPVYTPPAPAPTPAPMADQGAYKDAVAREVRESLEKLARMRPLAQQFQPVFDQVQVEQYGRYVNDFVLLNKRARYTIGSSESDVQVEAAKRSDSAFLAPLFLRMAVACVEMAQAGMGTSWTEQAMYYLWDARNLGYPDANEIMNQISALGLDSLFVDRFKGSLTQGAADWREAIARGDPRQLKLSPPISLAERQKIYTARRQAAEEAARQKAVAEAARMAEVARQKQAAEEATVQRVLKAVDARWRTAGIDYSLLTPLSSQREASLVQEALTALARYEDGVVQRGSRPKQVRGLAAMKATLASASCSPSAAANCMPLLIASAEAASAYYDEHLITLRHHIGVVECHARRLPVACRSAATEPKRSEVSDEQWQTKKLAYWTLSCVSPGEMKGVVDRCASIAYFLLKGDFGSPDTTLANDLYRLACALGDGASACEKVAADASSPPAFSVDPSEGKVAGKPQTDTRAAPARGSKANP